MNKKFYLIKKYVSAVMASLVAIAMVVTMVLPTCSGVKSVEADGDVHESTNLFVLQGDKPALSTGLTGTIDSVYINSQLLSTDDYGVNTGNQVVIRTLDSYITDKSTVTINLLRIHSSSGSVKTYTLYYAPKNCYYDMGTKKYYTNGYSISTFPGEVLNLPAGLTIEKSLVKVNTGVTLFDVVDSVYDEKTGQYIFPSQNWGSSNFGSFSLGIYTDKGMYVYKFEGSNNTTDSMVVSPSSITLDNNKENLTAVTHLYNFTGSDLANVLDGNGNSIDYSTDASTNGSSNYTLSNLQKLGNGSHEIIFKTKSGNTATFTVTLNGITAPTLTKYFDEYDATSPTTISTSLVTNGSTVNSITYSNTKFTDQPIGTTDVEITTTSSGKQYTFTDDFLKSLNNGVTTVNFNLKNGDVSYSLPFGIAVSKAAEAYKPGYENMVLEINNSDPVEWGDNSYDVSIRLGTYLDGTKDTFKGVYLVNDINSLDTSHPLNYTKKDSASYGSYDFDLSISNKEITDNYKLGNCYIMFEFSGEADFTHGFTLQSSIGMDSSGIFDFNTSSANSGDKTINITKNNSNVDPSKYTLDGTDITDKITDYTDNGTTATFIIPASYMSGLSKRDHTLTVDFNSGATATYKLKVQDSSATLSSESAVYNKDIHDTTNNNEPTVTLTTKDNGYTTDNQKEKLLGIKLDSETGYIDASNYTESNGKYTFKKDYLNTLSTKDHKFTFDMQGSADLTYTVKVMNTIKSSTISGSPAYYDKTAGYTNHENISAVLSLNGNIVNSVKDSNGKTLSADTDYTLSTDKTTYTFTYTYLDTLKDSANTLTFEMDQGGDLPFVINVNKSVNSTWYSAADESGMYDQNLSSLNNKDLTFYIKKGDNTISSIKNGSTPLSQTNGDYTVATVTHEGVSCYQVTLKKSYLQTASSTNLAIGFDQGGVTLYYALIVNNTTQDSELSAASATYDHTAGYPNSEQVSVTVTLKGNTVKEITDNGSKISNSAWSKQVSDDGLTETYTFAKTYLDNLTADKELKFVMDQGATKTELPFTIIYHKSVNSEFATAADSNGTFDKEVGNDANKDLTFKIKKGSNAFDKIMVGKNTLTSGTDGQYTISGPDTEGNYTITIKKDYLMTLPTDVKRSTGTAFDIYFNYGGDAAIRSYTVTVYETKSAEITGDTKGTFDKKAGSDNNKDIVITLDPGQNTFEGVKIDGNDINSSYYDYNNGVLTIKKDALKDLSNENHTITIGMSAGTNPEFTLKVTDTTDTDGDEVPDIQEEKDGTKANDPTDYKDSDGDGVPDFVEEKDGTDPEDSNDWKDKDHNGVPDYVDTHFPDESDDKDDDNKPDYQKDTDGDEVPDFVEGQQETDKNDASDFKDTDKDGVPDYVEDKDGTDKNDASKYKDTDGDEVPDYVENHKDNTDSKDATEYKDTDGDGVPDYVEDRDNTDKDDAISFKDESPKNDVPDYVDNHFPDKVADYTTDSDGDEVPDGVEDNQGTKTNDDKSYLDSDGDGVPDYVEDKDGTDEHNATEFTDDDKDGIPDYVERHDGNDNTNPGGDPSDPDDNTDYTKDTDGDGVPDFVEGQQGTDPKDASDFKDTDKDGVPDYVEDKDGTDENDATSYKDTDGDQVPDYVEDKDGTKADNGGESDYKDTDGDGVPDYVEQHDNPATAIDDATSFTDKNNNDVPDYVETHFPDEVADYATDTDGDGVPDGVEDNQGTGKNDPDSYKDSDGDGVPDYVEDKDGTDENDATDFKDSDGDGIPDYVENQDGTNPDDPENPDDNTDYTKDTDGDEVPDFVEDNQKSDKDDADSYKDTDKDGVPDYVEDKDKTDENDADSYKDTDGDKVPDYVEEHKDGTDPKDGTDFKDSDKDGVPDYIEDKDNTDKNDASDFKDTDKDGVPDYVEDKDGTDPKDDTSYKDSDGDKVPDYVEDKDGTKSDDSDSYKDTDGDGVPDYVEDKDGTKPDDATDYKDTDGDGDPDYVEDKNGTDKGDDTSFTDKDNDGKSDYEDDTDGDGVPDAVEDNQGTDKNDPNSNKDSDGDGVPDYVEDKDGTDENDATSNKDTDDDGIPDYVEDHDNNPSTDPEDPNTDNDYTTDTDKDGVPDAIEDNQGTDKNDPDSFKDSDKDGVPDYVEDQDKTDENDADSYKDSDGDEVPDYVEDKDGTKPNDGTDYKDTDKDRVPDYVEDKDGTDKNDASDFKDTDKDGVPDYVEDHKDNTDKNDASDFKDDDKDGVPNYVEDQDGTKSDDKDSYKDTDGDGVPDYVEEHNDNTDPDDATDYKDTDKDGDPDYVEDKNGTDPKDDGSFTDKDNDGKSDYEDDKDGDGVPDAVEDNQGTDPTDPDSNKDSDGDGVPDYVENQDGTDPSDASSNKDSDKDGVPDYVEEKDGTNPNDASDFKDSDKDGIPDYLDKVDNSNNGITNSGSNNGSGSKNGTGSNNKSTTKTNTNVKSGKATKTGDMANAGVYGALGGSSLLLYAVLLVLKRRKHEK